MSQATDFYADTRPLCSTCGCLLPSQYPIHKSPESIEPERECEEKMTRGFGFADDAALLELCGISCIWSVESTA